MNHIWVRHWQRLQKLAVFFGERQTICWRNDKSVRRKKFYYLLTVGEPIPNRRILVGGKAFCTQLTIYSYYRIGSQFLTTKHLPNSIAYQRLNIIKQSCLYLRWMVINMYSQLYLPHIWETLNKEISRSWRASFIASLRYSSITRICIHPNQYLKWSRGN